MFGYRKDKTPEELREEKVTKVKENLNGFIRAAVNDLVRTSSAPGDFTVERTEQMTEALTDFVVETTEKYIKGQIEHGDNLATRADLQKERQAEIQDLFWYNTAELWKK